MIGKIFLSLVVLALLLTSLFAEEVENSAVEKPAIEKPAIIHGFGFAAGPYAGIGLSYKAIIKDKLGVQATVGYYSDSEKERWFRPGLELQYYLSHHKWLGFYLSAGVGHEYDRQLNYDYYYYPMDTEERTFKITKNTTAGLGFGWEAVLLSRLSVTAEAVYFFRDDESSSIMIQGGLHYYVNLK